MQPTSATGLLLKAYKQGLRKLQSASPVDEPHQVVQQARSTVTLRLERARLRSEINPRRALANFQEHLFRADVRHLWQSSKQRAKQRLQRAYAAVGSYEQHRGTLLARDESHEAQETAPLYGQDGVARSTLLYLVAQASRLVMHRLNTTTIEGGAVLQQALARSAGQPLVTVCNHVAAMDDPLLVSAVVRQEYYTQPDKLRWTLCATDRCFKNGPMSAFFRAVKVLPIQRGAGLQQPGMAAAEGALLRGEWVHVFPEGTRSRDGSSMGPVRKGVGRLVAAAAASGRPPMVVPFVHSGMDRVMPRGAALPSVGQQVHVLVGEPIPMDDLLTAAAQQGWAEDHLHVAIAQRIASHMHALKARLDGCPADATLAEADVAAVSSLDLYDPGDLLASWDRGARARKVWERLQFKMQHRAWQMRQRVAALREQRDATAGLLRARAGAVSAQLQEQLDDIGSRILHGSYLKARPSTISWLDGAGSVSGYSGYSQSRSDEMVKLLTAGSS